MARPKKLSSVETGVNPTEPQEQPAPVKQKLKLREAPARRTGLVEAFFHQGVTIKLDKNIALNNFNLNNPANVDLSLEFGTEEQTGPCVVVSSKKFPAKKVYVPMTNVRYFVIEE